MNNEPNIENNILKDWFFFREQSFNSDSTPKKEKPTINLDEIYKKILEVTPKENQTFIRQQLNLIDNTIIDYIVYWDEKHYLNGFSDGIKLILNLYQQHLL